MARRPPACLSTLFHLALLIHRVPPILGEHSSSRSLMLPELEDCKLGRERAPHPESMNNRLTNVLMHEHSLNVTLKMYIMPPLRVRLESQTMLNDEVLAVHAKIFIKMTYKDPAVPNRSYPSLVPSCEELWLPQPRPDDVAHAIGRDAPTRRTATLRISSDGTTSSLWDERIVAFPQSDWVYVNFPFDVHVATMRFRVNDANIHHCNNDDLRAHTLNEMRKVHKLNESEYLKALAPSGWTVAPLSQWRASTSTGDSYGHGFEYDAEYCTIEVPLTRDPKPYVLKYYVFDMLFMLAGTASAHFNGAANSADRYSIIAVCMLLMLTTLQRDLGYGPVEYLTVVNIHSFISMLVLTLCLCQTVVIHRLGDTPLAAIVDRVGCQTLVVASGACAVGFLVQLMTLRPAPSGQGHRVYAELPTDAVASHLWPWIVFGLPWLAINLVRMYLMHQARARVVRTTLNELQRRRIGSAPEAAEFDKLSAEAFQLLDEGKRGLVSSQELRPFLDRIAEAEGTLRKGTFTSQWALDAQLLVAKPQGIGLQEFQELARAHVAGTSVAALEGARVRRRKSTSEHAEAPGTTLAA